MSGVMSGECEVLVRHPDVLGESPAYDAANRRLVWVDMFGQLVRELMCGDDQSWTVGRTWDLGRDVGAVVPRAGGGLVVAAATDVLALSDDGDLELLASLDAGSGVRFGDAKCDHQGRLVVGSAAADLRGPGRVIRLDPDGSMATIMTDVALANGFDWSADGGTFYFIDTAAYGIDAFDYDATSGTLSNRRTVVTIERGAGGFNGMTVDDEGFVWVAVTYGGEVRRYAPDGTLADVIGTPTRRPTSCAFGGLDGGDLLITSSTTGPPRDVLEGVLGVRGDVIDAADRDERGGAVFVCRPGVCGPPATPFAG